MHRIDRAPLTRFAQQLFEAGGLEASRAESVARLLVLTDMMGRPTHGLAACKPYLEQLDRGMMSRSDEPEVVRDDGATIVWDGRYAPGLWLLERAIAQACDRARAHGVVTHAIRRSHHIGCLAALMLAATQRGFFITLLSSGPHGRYVAPHGGKVPLFSPNPIGFGFPAGATPVLVDTSASLTTVSMTREKAAAGASFDQPWLLDAEGRPTRDPRVFEQARPPGSLMLLGGLEAGHKGFGLALMVEALTQGLGGHGRRDDPKRWGASVYLQIIDPDAFAGRGAFTEQMAFFADQCRASAPIDPAEPVRLPGDLAMRRIDEAHRLGVPLSLGTIAALREEARRLAVDAGALD